MARALFGGDGAWSSPDESVDEERTARLVEIMPDGNGGSRGRWVEVFESDSAETDRDREPQISFLD